MPSAKRFLIPHVTFSEMLRLSSWARLLMIVMSSSPLESSVKMFSFSKYTSTPAALSFRTVVRVSTVFRAKRLTDFVRIRSIFPAMAAFIMALNPSRCLVLVPVMPSSVNIPANSQPSCSWMYWV